MRRHRQPAPVRSTEDELKKRLEQAETRYRALTERLPIVTYVGAIDVQGSFTYISPQVEALLGFKPEQWLTEPGFWLKRMHPEDRRRLLPTLGRVHARGKNFFAEYRLIDRAGRAKWIIDESEVVRDNDGEALFIQGMWTEVTERKRSERETEGRVRELESSKSQLDQFVSIASHELNAPLRRIINLAEMLGVGDPLGESARGHLARIKDSAATMQGLVAALVQYGQADQRAPLSPVDLELSLTHVINELTEEIAASQARITHGPLPKVWAEPALLERVLRHLLDNAIKFRGNEPPHVHISSLLSGGNWVVSVRDNGIGIPHRQAQRIFAIFDRLHSREAYPGVGLGLAVCKKIIESFGGRIWVESEPDEGSTFHFTLLPPLEGGA